MFKKFVLGIALLASLPLQAQRNGTGLSFDDDAYQKSIAKASLLRGDYQQVPSSSSLKPFSPPPGNQLQLNTGVGWAVSYAAMTILKARQNNWTDPKVIQQNSFSPVYSYYKVKPDEDNDCSAPISLDKALNSLKEEGAPKFVEFLEFCPKNVDPAKVPPRQSVTGFNRLYNLGVSEAEKISSVKKAISEGYPVVIGMYVPPSFNIAKEFWQPREKFDTKFSGQALCVVGYDDQKYGGAFEIMNSWGKQWGNQGYMWIPYQYFGEFTRYAFEIYDVPKRTNADLGGALSLSLFPDKKSMPVKLLNSNGDYRVTDQYGDGTSFKIIISNNATAFVYALGTDTSGSVFKIFPDDGVSPVLPYKSNNVPIPPDEAEYITIEQPSGSDFLGIIYSREEIQIGAVLAKMNSGSGSFSDRLRKALGNTLVPSSEVNFSESSISFQGKASGGSAVVITAEIVYK